MCVLNTFVCPVYMRTYVHISKHHKQMRALVKAGVNCYMHMQLTVLYSVDPTWLNCPAKRCH